MVGLCCPTQSDWGPVRPTDRQPPVRPTQSSPPSDCPSGRPSVQLSPAGEIWWLSVDLGHRETQSDQPALGPPSVRLSRADPASDPRSARLGWADRLPVQLSPTPKLRAAKVLPPGLEPGASLRKCCSPDHSATLSLLTVRCMLVPCAQTTRRLPVQLSPRPLPAGPRAGAGEGSCQTREVPDLVQLDRLPTGRPTRSVGLSRTSCSTQSDFASLLDSVGLSRTGSRHAVPFD